MIPNNWELNSLPDLCSYQNGKAFPSEEYCQSGVRLLKPGNLSPNGWVDWDNKHRTFLPNEYRSLNAEYMLRAGDIVMNLTAQSLEDEFLGRVCRVPRNSEGLLNQRLARIVPRMIDPEYLFWALRGPQFRKHVDSAPKGSKVKHLYNRDLDTAVLPVPPLPEQRKIAAILSSVDGAIEDTQAVIDQLGVVKKAMMAELLTKGIPGRHKKFKMTEIGEVPEEWEVVQLGTVFSVQLGKMLNKAALEGERFPYLANRNVQWNKVVLDDLGTMAFDDSERQKFSLFLGDLLVCEGGEVGRTAIWRGEIQNCYFQKAIHRLRPRTNRAHSEFFLYYMEQAAKSGMFLHLTGKSSIAHLTKEKLETIWVPVPAITEQKAISDHLFGIEDRIYAEARSAKAAADVKSALMSVLLTGEVRVKPDEGAG